MLSPEREFQQTRPRLTRWQSGQHHSQRERSNSSSVWQGTIGDLFAILPLSIAKPLHRLTEKTARFEWTPECHEAFQILRQRLCSAPILVFPNFNKPFILDTDASNTGIGGVLSQLDEAGNECVIAYASRTLSKAERRYCVTRRELLAVVTFTQHFRPYLLGRQFTLRTDHGSLTWLQSFKEPEGRSASPVAGEVTRVPVYHCPQTRQKACECGRLVTLAMHSVWKRKPPNSGACWECVVSKVCT